MRVEEVPVLPRLPPGDAVLGHLPGREHHQAPLAVDRVPVHVHVGELVVGPDPLELEVGLAEHVRVPQPDVVDDGPVALDLLSGQFGLRREGARLDAIDPVRRPPAELDVARDVLLLPLEFLGRDLEPLHGGGEDRPGHDGGEG